MTTAQREHIRQLYQTEYRKLFAIAYARLHDAGRANDAVQQTFTVACQRPEALLDGPRPDKWLLSALLHVVHEIIRDAAKRNGPSPEQLAEQGAPPEELPLEVLYGDLAETEAFQLMKAVGVEGKSYEELARELGISVNACRIRVMRAKRFLQEALQKDEVP